MTRAGWIIAFTLMSSVAQAQNRASAYQWIDRHCEKLITAAPEDVANLAVLHIPLPTMCQCIASTMTPKLLDSELALLGETDKFPPHVEALWTASRGFCAETLRQK